MKFDCTWPSSNPATTAKNDIVSVMQVLSDIIGDYATFIDTIAKKLKQNGFDLNDFSQMDHICYRTVSLDNYAHKKEELSGIADLLGEKLVNNRLIAVFRLREPIIQNGWRVDCIELPAPKEGSPFEEGLEHAEMVIYDNKEKFLEKYKDKNFDMKSADRGINPEIGFYFDQYAVKFHLLSLATVLFIEEKMRINEVKD